MASRDRSAKVVCRYGHDTTDDWDTCAFAILNVDLFFREQNIVESIDLDRPHLQTTY